MDTGSTWKEHPSAMGIDQIDVYLEIGKKRTFAGAVDWPGWCRSGRDEETALQALVECGPRYASIVRTAGLRLLPPSSTAEFHVIEKLVGNATTDFGAPDSAPSSDTKSINEAELERFQSLLEAAWAKIDQAASTAAGKALRKGPRGGGREVEEIVQHVQGAEIAYLGRIGGRLDPSEKSDPAKIRQAVLQALSTAAKRTGEAYGPRGGKLWEARYFVRRVIWHVLDHAWEIEDRLEIKNE